MKLLDYQYIYLMRERRSRRHKIGISAVPHKRWQTVNRAVRGDVKLLIYRKVFFARSVERYLHRFFGASRFILGKAGPGAGHTEWFHLNFLERWLARLWIELFWLAPVLLLAGSMVLFLFFQGNWQDIDWSWWDATSWGR